MKDEFCRWWEFLRISEKSCKHRDYLYHEYCHTGYHTYDKHDRIGHCPLDLTGYRVDFFCLFCDLEEGLIEFTSTFSGLDDRCFRITK